MEVATPTAMSRAKAGGFSYLSALSSGRGAGKALLLLGLIACIYQFWRKWRIKCLVSTKFRGKVVLITGASSGLGEGTIRNLACMHHSSRSAALARVFYAAGSKVIIASRNLQALEQLKFQLDNEPKREVREWHGCTWC